MTSNKTKEDVSCTGDEEEKRPLEDPSGGENTSDATKCGEASSKQPPAYGENTAKKEAKTTMTAQASDEKKDDVKSASGAEQRKIKRTLRGFYTINKYIQSPKANMNDLQTLHAVSLYGFLNDNRAFSYYLPLQICYDRIGTPSKVKNNLRKFDGFEFSADSDEYKKRLNATQNISIGTLKGLCEGLNLNSEGLGFLIVFLRTY